MAYNPHTYASGDSYDYTDQNRVEQALAGAAADYRQVGTRAPSTWWTVDSSILTVGAGTAPTSGRLTFHRLALRAGTYTALGVYVTTAQVGGTIAVTLGLYPDDGSGSWPDTSAAQPIASSSNGVYTATGWVQSTFASALTLPDGIYWAAFLYVASVAPTTAPIFGCCTNNFQVYGRANSTALTTAIRGYARNGMAALPTGAAQTTATLSVSGASDVPTIGIRTQ